MLACFTNESTAVPIETVPVSEYPLWLSQQTPSIRAWLSATQFKAEPGAWRLLQGEQGALARVVCCVSDKLNMWDVGSLALSLPEGCYQFVHIEEQYAIAWGLGAYQFTRYKKPKRLPAKLLLPSSLMASVTNIVESIYFVRDLINTPTEDMGPSELSQVATALAAEFKADFSETVGDALLRENYPAIHTVGRACDDAPRLIDIRWGNPSHQKITLVGKGVCFDTGGLDIKPSHFMALMKKDMGGAAHVLGLARMIMSQQLPVRLRVLIPAVENSVSGSAFRPGDVIKSRQGLTIEVGNTDAEGRLVLADALAEAASESPDLIIDMATLTGAARAGLGADLPAFFCNQDNIAHQLLEIGFKINDPMWSLPLFEGYRDLINSNIADINNESSEPYGGAITAALFLREFVGAVPWMHFDIMAWNLKTRPGRPQGGEAMVLRALFHYLQQRE